MRLLRRLKSIPRSLFRRRRTEVDLGDEFRDHLDREIENNIRSGMTPEEARSAARRLIGPMALYKEECRDARNTNVFEALVRDVRYALRALRRTPLFAIAAISTLALGIGANTTVFTFVENILLRQLPVHDPRQLVTLNWGDANLSYPNYVDLRDRNSVFSSLIAYRYQDANISLRARDNMRVWGYEATGNYFETLGIRPLMGRFFGSADDDKPGAHPVLVVSYRFWQSHLAADPNAIGRAIKINGYPFTIIGVAPASFHGTELIVSADYWVPLSMLLEIEPGNEFIRYRTSQNLWVLGRLKPGVSIPRAEANLEQIGRQLARLYPDEVDAKSHFHLSPPGLVGDILRKPISAFGVVLTSVAGAGLLLACVNLAGMLLARAADRRREVAIRLALGASRFQLLRQWMTESLLLAIAGGLLGYFIAFITCGLFNSWRPDFDIPFLMELHPNGLVLLFAAVISLLTTVLFGLAPAIQAIRTDVIPSLKNEPAWTRFRSWNVRDVLVAGQIALSMTLVICSVLVVRSLQHALSLNLGFNPDHAVSLSLNLNAQGYNSGRSRRFDAELVAKASALPGIESAGIISTVPLTIAGNEGDFVSRTDRPVPPPSERRVGAVYKISPGYFRAAGTRLLRGRNIDNRDREGAPSVVVVNEELARVLFPNENPLGMRIRMSTDDKDPGVEIVGVVETGRYESIGEDPKPAVFLPIAQTGTSWTTLVARTGLPPAAATELLRKAVLDLNPELTVFGAGSLKDKLALPLFPARAAAIVLGVFGALAMVLAATGLFALMANAVARRTREMGIRMALGAQPSQVLFSILRRTLALCAFGISIGAVIALIGSRLLSAILYGVSPHDPATYITALVLMTSVALLACWNPAVRVIRIDPSRTLREE